MQPDERIKVITSRLQEKLNPSELEVIDNSAAHAGHAGAQSGAGHYTVVIQAACFTGLSPIKQHQLVYDALTGLIGPEIHALSIKASTP